MTWQSELRGGATSLHSSRSQSESIASLERAKETGSPTHRPIYGRTRQQGSQAGAGQVTYPEAWLSPSSSAALDKHRQSGERSWEELRPRWSAARSTRSTRPTSSGTVSLSPLCSPFFRVIEPPATPAELEELIKVPDDASLEELDYALRNYIAFASRFMGESLLFFLRASLSLVASPRALHLDCARNTDTPHIDSNAQTSTCRLPERSPTPSTCSSTLPSSRLTSTA